MSTISIDIIFYLITIIILPALFSNRYFVVVADADLRQDFDGQDDYSGG